MGEDGSPAVNLLHEILCEPDFHTVGKFCGDIVNSPSGFEHSCGVLAVGITTMIYWHIHWSHTAQLL